ncbi:hypothetical protein Cgig2_025824 [Carnegiea gigantea]|uniref:Uncharacterized protein n=1 Tax=Carnegiea gigantea TaxID=171969 RepID=A0A9Q1JMH6_9CARY|nr:hypothetical protein Cgig2_025824 [Carnegiea gigantea]
MHSKNTAQESSEKTITDSHQQSSEETDDMVEDTTYKMLPPSHLDESDSDDEVLVKTIKKRREGTKSKLKKMELRSQPGKKEDVKKSSKLPVKSAQLLVTKHKKEDKSLKKKQHVQNSAVIPVEGPNAKPAERDTKHNKIFQSRMSSSGCIGIIAHFNEAQTKAIQEMGFEGFLHLQVTELPGDLCKWLVDRFVPYSITLYISKEKRIEITLMDVHITLALPIGGKKVEEFYGKYPKYATYNQVLDAWRKDWNLQDGTPKLTQMPQYILSKINVEESFKRNFVLYMISCFFNGSKNVHCSPYFAKNVAHVEDIASIDWCQYTIDRLCESVKKMASNFDGPILCLMVSSLHYIRIS